MTKRSEDPDRRLWEIVAATVRPLRGRGPREPTVLAPVAIGAAPIVIPATKAALPTRPLPQPSKASPRDPRPVASQSVRAPDPIEPGRRRRLTRGRDATEARLDLHGLTQDQARAVLTGFVLKAWRDHERHVLIITGKGALGDGILRRRVPEWIAEPPLRQVVAGMSEAHRRHGGEGALYVALKRANLPA